MLIYIYIYVDGKIKRELLNYRDYFDKADDKKKEKLHGSKEDRKSKFCLVKELKLCQTNK